jgi:hypothetical protein
MSTQSTAGRDDREASPELSYSSKIPNIESGTRSYRRSNLSAFRSERYVSTPETQERSRYAEPNPVRVEGTDSTMSTTAPSTVWDELDELKSRIRKLELTGKLPSSSAAAMSTAERPRTATTTVTTMSSSPKQGKASVSPTEPAIDGVPSTVHPLLQEALRKAKSVLSSDVYQKLETTSSDALQLAAVMATGLQPGNGSAIGASSAAERQLRRRADSMCRGLTELTIALSSEPTIRPFSQHLRPSSRDASSAFNRTPPTTSYSVDSATRFGRRYSNDTEDTPALGRPRVQSRLDNRRASLLHNSIINSPPEYNSPEIIHTPPSNHPQNQMQPTSSSRLNRAATRLRSRRTQGLIDGADDTEDDNSPPARPVSRARTEVSLRFRSPRDRTSIGREYTSSHPLPTSVVRKQDESPAQRSPSVMAGSGLSSRRNFTSSSITNASNNLSSPATPRDNIQPGYRRYVSSTFGRESSTNLSSTEHTPDNVTVERGSASGSRRASRIISSRLGQVGNFVNGRLRAAKAERERQEALQQQEHEQQKLRVGRQRSRDGQENEGVY